MSYLDPTRVHFTGKFQAAPLTVNNDPGHYDNAAFIKQYQQLQTNSALNGWWNPRGDADFRLIGCQVTSAWLAGQAVAGDPVLQCLIADSGTRVAGKIVDLDSEQQMVSQLWGLEVRVCTTDGITLMKGRFQAAAFTDIWFRATNAPPGSDTPAGAMYQSVLEQLEWGDVSASRFLTTLKTAAATGRLSIKFNVDDYNMTYGSPDFTRGRVVGTIGPAAANEPDHLTLGRHFMTANGAPPGGFFQPAGKINFCTAVVHAEIPAIYIDLGNALPTDTPGSPLSNLGTLTLAYQPQITDANGNLLPAVPIGTIPYTDPDWYTKTAGVTAVSIDAPTLTQVQQNPLALLLTAAGSSGPLTAISEPSDGLYLRADQFVFRINPGEAPQAILYATQFGQPYANANVVTIADPSQLQPGTQLTNVQPPPVATPADAVSCPCRIATDAHGIAKLPMATKDPKNPRLYIDGQVYGIRPMLEDTMPPPYGYLFNPSDFISILLWNDFKSEQPPTWHGSIYPIFKQYANLYPIMDSFLDLGDYDSVCAHTGILLMAYSLPMDDPNSMPVTRDLSAAKRKTILDWLKNTGPDGKPLRGTPPPETASAPVAAAPSAGPPAAMKGGKASAMARRLVVRRGRN